MYPVVTEPIYDGHCDSDDCISYGKELSHFLLLSSTYSFFSLLSDSLMAMLYCVLCLYGSSQKDVERFRGEVMRESEK